MTSHRFVARPNRMFQGQARFTIPSALGQGMFLPYYLARFLLLTDFPSVSSDADW